MPKLSPTKSATPSVMSMMPANPATDWFGYWIDAAQRSTLMLDVMRQRTVQYEEHAAKTVPTVLKFGYDPVMDGRKLPRPVNYGLVRVRPPVGVVVDPSKRPFVVVDPRAGHGPGIGGFKPDSEIGVAFKAGHPCYFIGFLPEPVPGQTIEDIVFAEAKFLERVIELHPEAKSKPAVIRNCQAGWAVMMLAGTRPELFGPIILAGAPLSYWAGVHGKNPMRYSGGMLGGSWLTALTSDLGAGKFDGAWLVSNFENLNPANTLWSKNYNLYSKIDTEPTRYLEFEQWWGGHVMLNGEEMQFIVDELFVGNKLATAEITLSDGSQVDFRNVTSPIVVFCSKGDNITPPQQALGWIVDLYSSMEDIRSHGQTIVYAVHESIGHLGIFVSGSVAKKEHEEFVSNIDLIDVLPPGLYEAVMTPKDASAAGADFIDGDYLVRFEPRTLDDIRAIVKNSVEDERKFAATARISDINLGLYKTFMQPWVRMWANEGMAEWMKKVHPVRMQYEFYSRNNPMFQGLDSLVALTKANRQPVAENNVFWLAQKQFSDFMVNSLNAYRDVRDKMTEEWFHAFYGSPMVQAMVGLNGSEERPRRKPGDDVHHRHLVKNKIAELCRNIAVGGAREAAVRALIYVRLPENAIDERSFNLLRQMRGHLADRLTLQQCKDLIREQHFMLVLDERDAVAAIPEMLAKEPALAAELNVTFRQIIDVVGLTNEVSRKRYAEIERIFDRIASPQLGDDAVRPIRAGGSRGQ